MNIFMLLEMAADAMPDRIAITSGDESLTYGDLLVAARGAAALAIEHGASRLAYLDVNGLAAPVALFGAALAGIPYVPINYRLTAPEIAALLERVTPALLVCDGQSVPNGIVAIAPAAFLARARAGGGEDLIAPDEDRGIAVELFTSGTTGVPKAAILRHDNLLAYILGTVEFMGADEGDAAIVTVPPYHIAGISAVLSSVYAGRRMVQLPNFDPAAWLDLVRRHGISNAFLVPTMLQRIVEHLDAGARVADLPALRALAYGGGKMPLPVIEKAMAQFPGVDFTNAYGLTETSSTICLLDPESHRAAMASDDPAVRRRLGSVGRPLPTIELVIRDEDGRELGPGEAGLVFVRGDQVAGEYHGLGSQTDRDGWFPTRDRGWVDDEGYLFLDGRADDVIVRGGENISPGEIEDVLSSHPAVSECAVVAVPDAEWGEGVGAAVVLAVGQAVEAGELQALVRGRLRSSRVPQAIRFVDALPYNETGKLLRRVIREEFAA
ncbi:Acyl-CoA synthetase (AMP-forming)/AMP-acid ligase II [Sphingomonas laterariae]|uniref:Acyl-CoA synthetase (AMP-forming)/AMP-acid ligase II n=1 Tax=Edaphosphingomonas laterariae TaxID=861865 RepID=A0A239BJW2_9SPHN|nr:AMP-binding protein [Sphingomonas laterariae]SNS08435.1 Acyl-CoA synthetase (AMP-forming)/AMP-acid ligase II [Sphingomonas laterariae]